MLTDGQKRALRARTLLDSGMSAKDVAKKCGYTSVNGMLGAISLADARIKKNEAVFDGSLRSPDIRPAESSMIACTPEEHVQKHEGFRNLTHADRTKVQTKFFTVEHGTIIIRKDDVTVSYRPDGLVGPTVHIIDEVYRRKTGKAKWFGIVGRDVGGKAKVAAIMRQISEAAAECAALIEDELRGGERDVDHHA